jgi:PIN domain nuclease of toxin-antitoxin system
MRLLLDTHTLAWWLLNDERLSARARDLIGDPENRIFASAISAFETATKHRLGKWPEIGPLTAAFEEIVTSQDFTIIPVSATHAGRAGALQGAHRDPFDRILAAQAQIEGLGLLTNDRRLGSFGIDTIW